MLNDDETLKQTSIEVVGLNNDSVDVYKEIRLRGLREEPQAFGSSLEREMGFTQDRWLERVSNPFNVIALENNIPIGTMGASVTEENNKRIAHIVGVFVAEEARGKGIGSKLLRAVLDKIQTDGTIDTIDLTVNKDQVAAIKLYEKFGFVITGEKKALMGDGKEHEEYEMTQILK